MRSGCNALKLDRRSADMLIGKELARVPPDFGNSAPHKFRIDVSS